MAQKTPIERLVSATLSPFRHSSVIHCIGSRHLIPLSPFHI